MNKRLKEKKQSLFEQFDELSNRRFELWFVDTFKCDVDENGVKCERILTEKEIDELQQLLIECESLKQEFLSL